MSVQNPSVDLQSIVGELQRFLEKVDNWREDSEFLIHAADVEGLCRGIDEELVRSRLQIMISVGSNILMLSRTRWMGDNPDNLRRRCKRSVCSSLPLRKHLVTNTADVADLDLVDRLSGGRVDLTYGRYIYVSRDWKPGYSFNPKLVRYFWRNACEVRRVGKEEPLITMQLMAEMPQQQRYSFENKVYNTDYEQTDPVITEIRRPSR